MQYSTKFIQNLKVEMVSNFISDNFTEQMISIGKDGCDAIVAYLDNGNIMPTTVVFYDYFIDITSQKNRSKIVSKSWQNYLVKSLGAKYKNALENNIGFNKQ